MPSQVRKAEGDFIHRYTEKKVIQIWIKERCGHETSKDNNNDKLEEEGMGNPLEPLVGVWPF